MYNFIFNNQSSSEYSAFVVNRPNIPTANEKVTTYTVPGRRGALTVKEGTYPDIIIAIDLTYVSGANDFASRFREIKSWLNGSVNNVLAFSDDAEFFYLVKSVNISENKRTKRYIGKVTVKFTCDPYQYAVSGASFRAIGTVNNPYDISHPLYKIVGTGACTITANGKQFKVNVTGNALIDTDRMVTYKEDGTLQNTSATGDYEDLYLAPGNNTITATSGFTVTVKPRWGQL